MSNIWRINVVMLLLWQIKKWPYWQISYTQNKRSKTEYLKDEFVEKIQTEVAAYKKFKKLVEKLVGLNVEISKERLDILKAK